MDHLNGGHQSGGRRARGVVARSAVRISGPASTAAPRGHAWTVAGAAAVVAVAALILVWLAAAAMVAAASSAATAALPTRGVAVVTDLSLPASAHDAEGVVLQPLGDTPTRVIDP